MNLNSDLCNLFLTEHHENKSLLMEIYNNTLYLSRDDVLSSIETQIKKWKNTRVNIPLGVYLPKNKYGSEHYLYYHFKNILPKHYISNGRGATDNEVLYLNDILLSEEIPSVGQIIPETITIITCVISYEIIKELKKQHMFQNLKIFSMYQVNSFINSFTNSFTNSFNEYYNKDFYAVCLTYKPNFIYKSCIKNDPIYHKTLRDDCISIYDEIKNYPSKMKINTSEMVDVVPLFAKFKNIPYCSKLIHFLQIEFENNYNEGNYDYSEYRVIKDWIPQLTDDINTTSDSNIIIVFTVLSIKDVETSHANIVIINKFLKEFEVFEPDGTGNINNFDISQNTNDVIGKVIKEYIPDYKFIPTYDFCYYGPQINFRNNFDGESDGICCITCVLYGVLRILNPDFTREEILEEIEYMMLYPDFGITLRKFNSLCEDLLKKEGLIE